MAFDLSDDSGADKPPELASHAPTGRASDVLLPPAPAKTFELPLTVRPATPFDPTASTIFWIGLVISILGFGYMLYGIWSGTLADPAFVQNLQHADRIRILGNYTIIEDVVRVTAILTIAMMLFLFYDDESTGYILLATAIVLRIAIPWLTQFALGMTKSQPNLVTSGTDTFAMSFAYFPGIPGILLSIWDIIRRIVTGLQQSQIRKSSLRYGQNAAVQAKRRNVFMGRCWNLSYCREPVRTRCPVYVKRFKPCWQHKMGCMCDENIAVLATAGDWRAAVSVAMAQLEGRPVPKTGNPLANIAAGPKIQLSMAEKKQRCRECVIYNTHQEHKYKLLVAVVFFAMIGLIYQFNVQLVDGISYVFDSINTIVGRFSLTGGGGPEAAHAAISASLAWFIITVAGIILFSKLLQLVEYCCFTIKI